MEAAINSARQITFTIIAMTVSLAVVFLPLVMVTGIIGRIFREFSVTIIVSIFASGVVSITLTPMMCSRILGPRGEGDRTWMERTVGGFFKRITAVYGRSLYFFLHHRWISAVTWVGCFAVTVWVFGLLPKTFIPSGDSGFIRGVVLCQEGISPDRIKVLQKEVDAILRKNPAVNETFTFAGFSQGLAFQPDAGTGIFKGCKPAPADHPGGCSAHQQLSQIPGIIPFLRPDPVLQISTGATKNNQGQYAFAISGVDADQVYRALSRCWPSVGSFPDSPPFLQIILPILRCLNVNLNEMQLQSYGLTNLNVEQLLKNAYSQNYTYLIKTPIDQYKVIVEAEDKQRSDPADVNRLYFKPSGRSEYYSE